MMFGGGTGPRNKKDRFLVTLPDLDWMKAEKLEVSWEDYVKHLKLIEKLRRR